MKKKDKKVKAADRGEVKAACGTAAKKPVGSSYVLEDAVWWLVIFRDGSQSLLPVEDIYDIAAAVDGDDVAVMVRLCEDERVKRLADLGIATCGLPFCDSEPEQKCCRLFADDDWEW